MGFYRDCLICKHRDRAWIEHLLASGASLRELQVEFEIHPKTLRRHDQFHSTVQPNVDPVTIIREMHFLKEEAEIVCERVMKGNSKNHDRRKMELEAIRTRMTVIEKFGSMINVRHKLDPHVTLPRWNNVMKRITDALEPFPDALSALSRVLVEEGPKDSSTYGANHVRQPNNVDKRILQLEEHRESHPDLEKINSSNDKPI